MISAKKFINSSINSFFTNFFSSAINVSVDVNIFEFKLLITVLIREFSYMLLQRREMGK